MIMNILHATKAFEEYLDQYDRNDDKIRLKIIHTYGVVRCIEEITTRMRISDEDRELAKLIALLHDIGRFEQLKRFNSFEPDVMDHAVYGVKVLFEEGMIRKFIKKDCYDSIIRKAIEKHSDYQLTGIEEERTLLHAKLIRDADKLDNCRVKLEDQMETMLGINEKELGMQPITPGILETYYQKKSIKSADRKTKMDYWLFYIAYFSDINYRETLDIIIEKDYVNRLIQRVPYGNKETEEIMRNAGAFMQAYMEDRSNPK